MILEGRQGAHFVFSNFLHYVREKTRIMQSIGIARRRSELEEDLERAEQAFRVRGEYVG